MAASIRNNRRAGACTALVLIALCATATFGQDPNELNSTAKARIEQAQAERARRGIAAPAPVDQAVGARALANELEFLRLVHASGGIVVPSTDVGAAPLQVPGFSLHRELELLVRAGISPSHVLQAATREAAVALGRGDDLGTIEPGKFADLLIIDGDPLTDIAATRRISTVVKDGVAYNPSDILARIDTGPAGGDNNGTA